MQITFDKKNYRKHSDQNKKRIRKSLTECGAGRSVLVDKDGCLIAGNGVYEQAEKMGIKTRVVETDGTELVVVKRTDIGTDDPKRKTLALADNATSDHVEWDMEMLQADFDVDGLNDWGIDVDLSVEEEPQEAQEDDFDEEKDPVATICQEGDVWQLGEHRLMCGDSTKAEDVARLMDGEKADLCFTDPPYGVSYTGGIQFKADGSVERNNREMIANDDIDIYAQVFEVLKDFVNGPCYVWFAGSKAASLYAAAEKYGEIHALLIWVKNGGYGALNANYKQKHEPCLYWKPKGATLNFIGATTETTIWEINKDGKNEYHPTQKPVTLPAKAINNHKCDIVLDLFGGSGSTLIACEQLHRKARLMELDPHYCDVIIARWEKITGQKAVKL
jgi:DNA modification methylase